MVKQKQENKKAYQVDCWRFSTQKKEHLGRLERKQSMLLGDCCLIQPLLEDWCDCFLHFEIINC